MEPETGGPSSSREANETTPLLAASTPEIEEPQHNGRNQASTEDPENATLHSGPEGTPRYSKPVFIAIASQLGLGMTVLIFAAVTFAMANYGYNRYSFNNYNLIWIAQYMFWTVSACSPSRARASVSRSNSVTDASLQTLFSVLYSIFGIFRVMTSGLLIPAGVSIILYGVTGAILGLDALRILMDRLESWGSSDLCYRWRDDRLHYPDQDRLKECEAWAAPYLAVSWTFDALSILLV